MALLDEITEKILKQISGGEFYPSGANKPRHNGHVLCPGGSEDVKNGKKKGSTSFRVSQKTDMRLFPLASREGKQMIATRPERQTQRKAKPPQANHGALRK